MAFGKGGHGLKAGRKDTTKFAQQATYHVRDLSSLANNELAGAVERQQRLLFFRLDFDKSHRRATHGFADRLASTASDFPRFT